MSPNGCAPQQPQRSWLLCNLQEPSSIRSSQLHCTALHSNVERILKLHSCLLWNWRWPKQSAICAAHCCGPSNMKYTPHRAALSVRYLCKCLELLTQSTAIAHMYACMCMCVCWYVTWLSFWLGGPIQIGQSARALAPNQYANLRPGSTDDD